MKKHGNILPKRTDRLMIFLTDTLGSLIFLLACFFIIIFYILWNLGYLPGLRPFDRYPFSGLDMVLSIFAIFLSGVSANQPEPVAAAGEGARAGRV